MGLTTRGLNEHNSTNIRQTRISQILTKNISDWLMDLESVTV